MMNCFFVWRFFFFFFVVLGIEPRASCMLNKYYHWATVSTLYQFYYIYLFAEPKTLIQPDSVFAGFPPGFSHCISAVCHTAESVRVGSCWASTAVCRLSSLRPSDPPHPAPSLILCRRLMYTLSFVSRPRCHSHCPCGPFPYSRHCVLQLLALSLTDFSLLSRTRVPLRGCPLCSFSCSVAVSGSEFLWFQTC